MFDYTQLRIDLLDLILNESLEPNLERFINSGQDYLEKIVLIRGYGFPFLEASPSYTPAILESTNTFELPTDYMMMLYITPTDQLGSPVVTLSAGTGSLAAGTYYYRVTALNSNGETLGSEEQSITVVVNKSVILSWTAITNATSYKIYGRTKDGELYIATTTNTTYEDVGTITPSGAIPTFNTTGTTVYCPIISENTKKFGIQNNTYIDVINKARPGYYKRTGNTLMFDCFSDVDYGVDFRYYRHEPTLSDSVQTNAWTEERNYCTLLYASAVQAIPYLGDDKRIAVWRGAFEESLSLLRSYHNAEMVSGKNRTEYPPNYFFGGGK